MRKQLDFIPSYLINRQEVEDLIESLLTLLDRLEADPDLEPWLAGFHPSRGDDRELDNCDDESTGDDEPYLSSGAEIWSTSGGQGSECDYERDDTYYDNPVAMAGGFGQ